MIALVVVGDGRGDYLEQAIASADANLLATFGARVMVNDSGDHDYTAWLYDTFPSFIHVDHMPRRGLAKVMQSAWAAAELTGADFIFHLEEDFIFNEVIPVQAMVSLLESFPHLCQFVLKRQPVSVEEINAGGQIETDPVSFTEKFGLWTQHRKLFSFNPSVIPRRVFGRGWPPVHERQVTDALLEDPANQFAYWGRRDDAPRCTHIGEHRSAGYAL